MIRQSYLEEINNLFSCTKAFVLLFLTFKYLNHKKTIHSTTTKAIHLSFMQTFVLFGVRQM